MTGFGCKTCVRMLLRTSRSNLFKVDVHVIFHVFRARNAAGRHHAQAGAACEKRRSVPRASWSVCEPALIELR